jgi:hypothetical protein
LDFLFELVDDLSCRLEVRRHSSNAVFEVALPLASCPSAKRDEAHK